MCGSVEGVFREETLNVKSFYITVKKNYSNVSSFVLAQRAFISMTNCHNPCFVASRRLQGSGYVVFCALMRDFAL